MKKVFFFTLLLTAFLTSCSSDSTDDLTIKPPSNVTYTSNVKAFIDQSCATSGCHNAATNTAGLTLETYAQVKAAFQNRNALGRMESTTSPMPPVSKGGNLPSTTITVIKNWKDQGYLE